MPRKFDIPACPDVPTAVDASIEHRTYTIEVVTPMFGGGAEAGQPDKSFPIRPTSIRGQLRFWWRATVGAKYDTKEMWRREEEIFGSTDFPSPLQVGIEAQPQVEWSDPTYNDRFGPIAYAHFPAIENNQRVTKEGFSFKMRLSWPSEDALNRRRKSQNECRKKERKSLLPDVITPINHDMEIAVRAWIAYGGIGGRTRRGCGAVHCNDTELLKMGLPEIPGARYFTGKESAGNALEAWKASLDAYRNFRQTPRGKKHKKTIQTRNGPKTINVPGRSHWPEADSIRNITGCSLKPQGGQLGGNVPPDENPHDHSTPVVPEATLPSFPRAALGLPINFHFADGPGKRKAGNANRDPQDVQLYPLIPGSQQKLVKAERMASPVLTRPVWKLGKWWPSIIILPYELPQGVRIEGRKAMSSGNDLLQDHARDRVANTSLSVLRPMRGQTSAINALVEFLTTGNSFKEVTP